MSCNHNLFSGHQFSSPASLETVGRRWASRRRSSTSSLISDHEEHSAAADLSHWDAPGAHRGLVGWIQPGALIFQHTWNREKPGVHRPFCRDVGKYQKMFWTVFNLHFPILKTDQNGHKPDGLCSTFRGQELELVRAKWAAHSWRGPQQTAAKKTGDLHRKDWLGHFSSE